MNIRHKRKEKEESVSTARELFQWVAAIVAAVLIALAIDNFVIVNAQIPSGSMENTIMTGDRVIGNRFAYSFSDPQRFDIIIFRYPDDESQLFIKRIIGLPGETVEIRDGKIYLNGSDEPLEDVQTKETMVGSFGPYTVPENSYFVMGDNRNDSISTKAGYTMWDGPYGDWGSRKYLLASLDQSLQRLGLDYVDIYYHHRMDPNTPLEETMGALATAVQSGKAIYAGLSNYNGETLEKATAILNELHVPFVINQNRYSIFDRTIEKNGLKETANRLGKGIIAFSPLAQGLLTDRYLHGIPADSRVRTDGRFLKESALTEEKLAQIRALNEIAAARGQTLAEMALAWILKDGQVTSVLIGASRPEQILDNIKALDNTTFTAEELEAIDRASGYGKE